MPKIYSKIHDVIFSNIIPDVPGWEFLDGVGCKYNNFNYIQKIVSEIQDYNSTGMCPNCLSDSYDGSVCDDCGYINISRNQGEDGSN